MGPSIILILLSIRYSKLDIKSDVPSRFSLPLNYHNHNISLLARMTLAFYSSRFPHLYHGGNIITFGRGSKSCMKWYV